MEDMPAQGRRLAKIVEDSLVEVIDENFHDEPYNEKVALLLFIAQLFLADMFLAASRDRKHALAGLDMVVEQIRANFNVFYDNKEKQGEPTRSE